MALVGHISGSKQSNSIIGISGSVIVANQPDSLFPIMPGTDVTFFVSGSSREDGTGVSVFGGDVVVSGSLTGHHGMFITGDRLEVTGSLEVTNGISGSLTQLVDGTSYLIAGTNITITSGSNGSITISSPTGNQGAQGDQGFQGAQGDAGAQGAQGDQGFQGAQGDAGAQGAQGDQGFQGAQGDGFNTVINPAFTRVLTSDGTSSGAIAENLLTFISSSNLLTVTGSIEPGTDITYNLGSQQKRWANVYTGDLHLRNERGDWTVVEEENDLTIKNNKTGNWYKFALIQIEKK